MRAGAHPEGFSGMKVGVWEDRARVVMTLHTRDMGAWFPPAKYNDYIPDVCAELKKQSAGALGIELDGQNIPAIQTAASSPETGMIEIDLEYPITKPSRQMQVWAKDLRLLPRGHQQLIFVEDMRGKQPGQAGKLLLEATLEGVDDSVMVDLPEGIGGGAQIPAVNAAAPTRSPGGISFFALGIEHIVTGYDHLLFLAALLLVCKNFRQAAGVITFFTVAHSITLSLAALDIVRLPARIVEPAIAASIIYVGLENIFGQHKLYWRAMVTFGFGLVHGLGFAAALKDVGLGSTSVGIVMPLVKFSIGLETGQLCIAAMILQLMLLLRRRDGYERRWVPAGSVLVSMIGGYWLVTRVLGV